MISDYYKQTVVIERYTESVNSVGTPVQVWTTSSTIAALLSPGGGNVRITDGKNTLVASHRLYCAGDTDATTKDRVVYGTAYYRIMFIKDPNTLSHHKELYLDEVK